MAPGVSEKVPDALGGRFSQEDKLRIEVVLDADPEVYRLGFGTVSGITKLKSHAQTHMFGLRHQPGIRIGILIADDKTLIYAPTPLLIEAGSTSAEKTSCCFKTKRRRRSRKRPGPRPTHYPCQERSGTIH